MVQLYLFFVHWLGDYILQTGDMALGKAKSIFWLNVHVAHYFVMLTFGTLVLVFFGFELQRICLFLLVNGPLHWLTDYFTSRWANYYRERNDDRHYWVTGFDQLIHYSTLHFTYEHILI